MKFAISIAIILFSVLSGQAQNIKGLITDDKKQPIPFATIFIEKLQTGTNSNIKGEYEISVKPGSYKLIYRSLGYKQVVREVVVGNTASTVNIELPTEVYQIKELVVKKGDEDPAYPIMRKVIAWAPYHLNQVKHYKSDVYLKGTMVIDKIPGILKDKVSVGSDGKTDKIKTGDVYLGESVNEIVFDAPQKYEQRVKSAQTSLPNIGNESVTPIDFIKSSLYQPDLMDCISPCSPEAFRYYKFVYEGYFEEGGFVINKIRVDPKRKSQQLFSGHLYIVEQYWSIQSADLFNEQFWGTLKVSQLCVPMQNSAWLPVSYNFHFTFSMFGFKAQYRYASSVKYNDIEIDKKLTGPVITNKAIVAGSLPKRDSLSIDTELQDLLAKDKLSFRDMRKLMKASRREQAKINPDTVKSLEIKPLQKLTVDSDARKRDSSYWVQNRAIPLTAEELKSYHKKDSIVQKAASDTAKTAEKKRKQGIFGKVLSGFTVPSKKSSFSVRYDGLIDLGGISFNTVDGWAYKQSFHVNWKVDSIHNLWISPELKYAFNRKELMGYFSSGYNYAPGRNGVINLNGGVKSMDFNQSKGINSFENTVASLFFRRNYMKLFEGKYVNLNNQIDLANGLRLNTSVNFTEMRKLENHSNYSFFYRDQRDYTSNIPDNDFFIAEQPLKSRSFTFAAGLTFTPEYHYRMEGPKKVMVWSRFPTFNLNYKTAIAGVFDSNSKYHLVTGGVNQNIKLKYDASFDYGMQLGAFFNVDRIHFSEFKHFNTQQLPITLSNFEQSFQLLDFYRYSTSQRFIEGHVHYESQLLLLKYLPLLGFTRWSENLYFNYLSTPVLKNYTEFGYGLNNILLLANVGVFASFENGKYKSFGAKLSINFGN
jgi:hypothetical protein